MNDVIVSLRIPQPMLDEIKDFVTKNYYVDISEGIRTILRDSWLKFEQPELSILSKLTKDIEVELKQKKERQVKREVIDELNKIRELIKEGGNLP